MPWAHPIISVAGGGLSRPSTRILPARTLDALLAVSPIPERFRSARGLSSDARIILETKRRLTMVRRRRFLWSLRNKYDNTSSAAPAAIEPSPAFQSRGSGHIFVPVAAAMVEIDRQTQPSLPRLRADALIVPALKTCHYPKLS